MKHRIARPDLLAPCGIICLACILLLSILSVTADAQVEHQAIEQAKKTYEANKVKGAPGGNPVLTAGAFDIETKTLWVASGPHVLQLDSSGKTIRSFELLLPEGGPPLQAEGLLVDGDFIRAAGPLHGTFEFLKPH